MNYKEQGDYFRASRWCAAAGVLVLLVVATAAIEIDTDAKGGILISFALIVIALAISLYYTPDYLHLSVSSGKKSAWEIKIRWRVIAVVLLMGLLLTKTAEGRAAVLFSVLWLLGMNLLARRFVTTRYFPELFWRTDFFLICVAMWLISCDMLMGAVLLAVAAHLKLLSDSKRTWVDAAVISIGGSALIYVCALERHTPTVLTFFCSALILSVAFVTAALVNLAEKHNTKNIAAAMRELEEFTGYSPDKIRDLWAISNQMLAANWQRAPIAENDHEPMAEWYRQNSGLYLFAISAYNLEYKRIKSNLKVIRYARGSCLDYGAGNGEILLELARRGHRVMYFDVEGETMKFARYRAERQNLSMQFARSKEELAAAAGEHGFDTVFSFDVLEHLPDLPGELNFLSSLLNPGGLLVFDVPAGSTKAHPMHLNHDLDVISYMKAKGFEDERSLSLKMPFRKEEKYVFRTARSPA